MRCFGSVGMHSAIARRLAFAIMPAFSVLKRTITITNV